MYKWPQGRVIRTISLLLIGIIAADLFFSPGGAWGYLSVYRESEAGSSQLAMGLLFSVLTLASLVAGITLVGFKPFSVDFLIEVEQEMVKVEWPTSSTLIRSTIVIAVATAIIGGVIYAVDVVNFHLFLHWLPKLFHTLSA